MYLFLIVQLTKLKDRLKEKVLKILLQAKVRTKELLQKSKRVSSPVTSADTIIALFVFIGFK